MQNTGVEKYSCGRIRTKRKKCPKKKEENKWLTRREEKGRCLNKAFEDLCERHDTLT